MKNGIYYLKTGVIIIFFLIIIVYAILKSKNIIIGPNININNPKNGETVKDRFLQIDGISKNSNFFSINNLPVLLDKDGNFSHKLLLQDGYNIIILYAKDRFGKQKTKQMEIICKCSEEK